MEEEAKIIEHTIQKLDDLTNTMLEKGQAHKAQFITAKEHIEAYTYHLFHKLHL